jgi:hypothetical protein
MTGAFLFSDPNPDPGPQVGRADVTPLQNSRRPPSDLRPVFGGGDFDRHVARWNDNCVFCHNVAPNPGRDPVTG